MEEVSREYQRMVDENNRRLELCETTFANNEDSKIRSNTFHSPSVSSEFELLKRDLLSRIEFLEKEIKEVKRKPSMVDFTCQTESTSYYGCDTERYAEQVDASTQTLSEEFGNENSASISSRLEELKYCINERINRLQQSLRRSGVKSSVNDYQNHQYGGNENENGGNTSPNSFIKYSSDARKVIVSPFSTYKPFNESVRYRTDEDSKPRQIDIRTSLENSKQLFQQEIEASLQKGRVQQNVTSKEVYSSRDKISSAFTHYTPIPSQVINSKGVCNVYNPTFYDGRRAMYHEKHSIQTSREEFARELIDEIFAYDELAHANVTGVKGKRLLDPKKIQLVKDSVLNRYPLQGGESEEVVWKLICDKINTKCRGVTRTIMKRKANNSLSGLSLDYIPTRKKVRSDDYLFDVPPSMANTTYHSSSVISPVRMWSNDEKSTENPRERSNSSCGPDLSVSTHEKQRDTELTTLDTTVNNRDVNYPDIENQGTNEYCSDRLSSESSDQSDDVNLSSHNLCPDNDSNNSLSNSEDANSVSFTQFNDSNSIPNAANRPLDTANSDRSYTENQPTSCHSDGKYESESMCKITNAPVDSSKLTSSFQTFSMYKADSKVTYTQPMSAHSSPTEPMENAYSELCNDHFMDSESKKNWRQECRGSRKELTRNLIDSMFSRETLAHSNVTGARGKLMLEPAKIAKVREMVFTQYPAANKEEEEVIWRKLTTKINTKCRGVKRFLKRKNLLAGDLPSKHDVSNEIDSGAEKELLRKTLGLDHSRDHYNADNGSEAQYVSMVGSGTYNM